MMFKRFAILTLTLLLLGSLNAHVWSQPECDFSYSNYARAVQLHDMGDYGRALRHYQCARLENPDSAIIPLLIQNLHQDSANARSAWSGVDARTNPAKFQMPDWLTPYEMAPDSRRQRQPQPMRIFSERPDPRSQPERQLAVVEAQPLDQPVNARQQARAALKARDLDRAIDWMLKVARADATAADYDFLASLYSMNDDMAGAERSLVQALELAPTRLDLRCRLGIVYVAQGETDAAYAQFDWMLSVDPANTCANEHRRALNRSLNAAGPAAAPITSPAQATFERGLAMLDARKLFAAANMFREALALDPAHLEARCQLGAIQAEWSNYGAALAHFERILAEAPQDACARGNRQAAVLDMLAMYIPLTVDDFYFRARTLANIEAWAPAADAIRRGLDLDPTRADIRCELGMLYAQLGDERAALREFDRVLAQDALDPCAWSNRDALMKRLRAER